jgi:hypothetical protein
MTKCLLLKGVGVMRSALFLSGVGALALILSPLTVDLRDFEIDLVTAAAKGGNGGGGGNGGRRRRR